MGSRGRIVPEGQRALLGSVYGMVWSVVFMLEYNRFRSEPQDTAG